MSDVFISYAREDGAFARKLADELKASGAAVWIDVANIRMGEEWDAAVQRALTECSALVVILSPDAVSSRSVMNEIAFALDRGKRVLPVLYRACNVPFQVARIQYADFTDSYDVGMATVKRALSSKDAVTPQDTPKRRGFGRTLLLGAGFGLLLSLIVMLSRFGMDDADIVASMWMVFVLWTVIGTVMWTPVFALARGYPERVRWAIAFAITAVVITSIAVAITGFVWGVYVTGPAAAIVGALLGRSRHRRKSRDVLPT